MKRLVAAPSFLVSNIILVRFHRTKQPNWNIRQTLFTYGPTPRTVLAQQTTCADPTREMWKQQLYQHLKKIKETKRYASDRPLTNKETDEPTYRAILETIQVLEASNPSPNPLSSPYIQLLDGNWKLLFSTAREITTLSSLPFFFQLQSVYQRIDVKTRQLENIAQLAVAGVVKGYVRVTGNFYPISEATLPPPELQEPGLDGAARERLRRTLQSRRVNVRFQKRSLGIESILGIPVKRFLETIRQVNVRPLVQREPSLDITYLDESFRIGRGGDGGVFVLEKPTSIKQ